MRCGIKILSLAILFSVFNARAESSTSFTCGVSYTTRADVESAIDACNRELNSSSTSATRKRGVEDNIKEYNHQLDDIAKREEATSASEKAKKAQGKLAMEGGMLSTASDILLGAGIFTCANAKPNPVGASAECSKSTGVAVASFTNQGGGSVGSAQSVCANPLFACGALMGGAVLLGGLARKKEKEAEGMGDICNLLSDGLCDPKDDGGPEKRSENDDTGDDGPDTTLNRPPGGPGGPNTVPTPTPIAELEKCTKPNCDKKCKACLDLKEDGSSQVFEDSNGDGKFNKLVASTSPEDVSRLLASDGFQKQVRAKFEKDNPDLVDELAAALGEKNRLIF